MKPDNSFIIAPQKQRGVTLITSVMMLVVVTLLALAMYNGLALRGKIAGNALEKERAFQAAQTTLEYAEWRLRNGATAYPVTTDCPEDIVQDSSSSLRICNQKLEDPEKLPWKTATEYTPSGMTVDADGGLTDKEDVKYAKRPAFHIESMEKTAGAASAKYKGYFRITTVGYGGSETSATVLQSVFLIEHTGEESSSGTPVSGGVTGNLGTNH